MSSNSEAPGEPKFIRICATKDIPNGEGRGFTVGSLALAVYRTEGKWYATNDICSHEHEHLHDGWLEGKIVECPRHGAQFSLETGEALSLPATRPIEVFPVEIKGEDVMVGIPWKYVLPSHN